MLGDKEKMMNSSGTQGRGKPSARLPYKKGGMVFKPCAKCPSPAKCKAAGKCMMKAKGGK